ncbi:hypothetical protein LCGC14_2632280 [marine sediment metagenome]|uniref:Uncharacterized protein n=1 Tax=marine sediment metagenome TaxID=412755 RepID=A0A0F9CAY0_9ZZZZ
MKAYEMDNIIVNEDKSFDRKKHCPVCCPHLEGKGFGGLYHKGFNGKNDDKFWVCSNCLEVTKRKTRINKKGISENQKKAIRKIYNYFLNRSKDYGYDKVKNFEVEKTDYGVLWLSIRNNASNYYGEEGGYFLIGKHGKITVYTYYGIIDEKIGMKHLVIMLGASIKRRIK